VEVIFNLTAVNYSNILTNSSLNAFGPLAGIPLRGVIPQTLGTKMNGGVLL